MRVIAAEREIYERTWQVPGYADHSPGEAHVALFMDMAAPAPGSVILDAGCGSGKGALALTALGFPVVLTDLTADGLVAEARGLPFFESCLWSPIGPTLAPGVAGPFVQVPVVYCCDVLEHIPTEYTMLTIARLLERASEGLFLSIALQPDQFGVWVGRPLHQTVRDFSWWRDRIADLGVLVEARDLLNAGVYYVRPR